MENPYLNDDPDKATEYLRQILPILARHNIPPSPFNFRLGYDYVAGNNEDLKNAFDELLQVSDSFNGGETWDLYRNFYVQDDKALERIRQELRHLIVSMQGEFERSGGNLSSYATRLSHFAEVLDNDSDPTKMAAETRRMFDGTRSMEASHRQFESSVSGMVQEVETLRLQLEQAKRESLTDALTGIANRKAFDSALAQSIETAQETTAPFSLLMLDIDHFKQFNDTYGHLVGDKVLRFIASILYHCIKGSDLAARYGGEEFAVILPNTPLRGATTVAEQIRKLISAVELKDKESGKLYGHITASIGIAEFHPEEAASSLIERADKALYTAKRKGRNRVEQAK